MVSIYNSLRIKSLMELYFPVTIGHETVMGKVMFFGGVAQESQQFDFEAEYPFLEELMDNKVPASVSIFREHFIILYMCVYMP